ncbi:MAG TPA: 3-hydroxyacyl-CoA dehydrogenase family protein [Desulfitobacteriaceae bacterium]|nr:3-hydroxyacyl-CoA dehydrogenase family protein [Desulfitobacteriaceae bacterium]
MDIRKIAVLGAGSMGTGIVQVCAQAGYAVTMIDISEAALTGAINNIRQLLERGVKKGRLTSDEAAAIIERIKYTSDFSQVANADLVIEAVPEDLDLKQELFKRLDANCPAHTILATNTSSLPVTSIAAVTSRPGKVLGMHFMNPVPLMKGVELIGGRLTSPQTMAISKQFIESLNKIWVEAVDYAGFIASRVLDVMLNEAVYCVMDGNKPEEIDKAMKVCTNFPMGPLEIIDLAGADVLLNVMEILEKEFGDKYRPAPLLRQMVRAGHLGRKTKQGFYKY